MRRILSKLIIISVLIVGIQQRAYAATCGCAGVPLLTSIDTSASEKGQFFMSYSVEDHQISDLVSGTDDVPDETGRDRSSVSQVISASYALTDRWSVSALVSYIKHSRTINSSFLGETKTSGFGDSVILARYTPLYITPFSSHALSVGLGARIPTGEDNFGDGFVTAEDMQPSTGALGKIFWSSYSYAFNQAATIQLNASANYVVNDENSRDYSFGDEFNLALGLSQNLGTKFGYSAAFRYRTTKADTRFDFKIPNTGGKWVNFVPAIQYSVNDRLTLGLAGRVPLFRDLKGALQFTTSYSMSFSINYAFKKD